MIRPSDLFNRAKFYSLNKSEDLNLELQDKILKIEKPESFIKFHSDRSREFLLGRLCASEAHKILEGKDLFNVSVSSNRAPLWPNGIVGSISHDKVWVGAAVAKTSDLLGIGIDFEIKGRAKLNLKNQITSNYDISTHEGLSETELLTMIFSMKECLYKALYPLVNKFFGFEDAAVTEINTQEGTFEIKLLTKLSEQFRPGEYYLFKGRFVILPESVLAALEIPA
jgi:enterobactin synthetase component D